MEGGLKIEEAKKVLILVHGRGGDARHMMELQELMGISDFALLAPQATNNTWYPYSFMAPVAANEPWLTSAIDTIHSLIDEVISAGIAPENIFLLGFSQGACLTLESAARKAERYGGIIAFTGGLIGENIDPKNYTGKFEGTPVLISSGDHDPHVPLSRVHETTNILRSMGADVTEHIYKGKPHTIIEEELANAAALLKR